MGQILAGLDRLIRVLVSAGAAISIVAMLAIMTIGTLDVIGTAFFSAPVPAALEAQEVLLAISIFLALAYAQQQRAHIDVDIVTSQLPTPVRHVLLILGLALGATICAIISWRSWELALESWSVREAANAIITFPIYPGKFLVSIGAALAALEFLRQLVWSLVGVEMKRPGDAIDSGAE